MCLYAYVERTVECQSALCVYFAFYFYKVLETSYGIQQFCMNLLIHFSLQSKWLTAEAFLYLLKSQRVNVLLDIVCVINTYRTFNFQISEASINLLTAGLSHLDIFLAKNLTQCY